MPIVNLHASLFRVIHSQDLSSFHSFLPGFSCSFGRGLVLEQGRPQSFPMRMSLRATAASSKCIRECIKLPISLTIVWMTGKQNVYSLHHPYVLFSLTLSDMIFQTYSCSKRNQLSIRFTGQRWSNPVEERAVVCCSRYGRCYTISVTPYLHPFVCHRLNLCRWMFSLCVLALDLAEITAFVLLRAWNSSFVCVGAMLGHIFIFARTSWFR